MSPATFCNRDGLENVQYDSTYTECPDQTNPWIQGADWWFPGVWRADRGMGVTVKWCGVSFWDWDKISWV